MRSLKQPGVVVSLLFTLCIFRVGGLISAQDSEAAEIPKEYADARDNHWAWAPLEAPKAPQLKHLAGRVRTPVDAFVFARQEKVSARPAAPADPAALLRRLYLDLIGIPPTIAEQEKFLKDPSDKAYAAIVDDLLERPQYGERWGRHWLDVARYAETKGYERDEFKKFVWRYRDYVIDAFNRDMPYDQFILEQLAGDEIEGSNIRTQVATTFLALGTFDTIAADKEVARYDTLDDIVATTSMAFLGQTVQCARCHDHMFEPISQVDYYKMLAAFESLQVDKKERQIGTEEDFRRHKEAEDKFVKEVLTPQKLEEEKVWRPLLERLKRDGVPKGKRQHLDDRRMTNVWEAYTTKPGDRTDAHWRTLDGERGRIRAALRELADDAAKEKLKLGEEKLKEIEAKRPQPTMAWTYPERGANPSPTMFRIRGDVHRKGDEIPFGVPVVLDKGDLAEAKPTSNTSGRRTVLANWITGSAAPLTARVMANRLWQFHFGRGFLQDSNNFGVSGGEPSHPQLLDWLASQLVEGGWRLKPLHRSIVMSETYRLSAQHDALAKDPENKLFTRWPVHRLQAEAIRDSVLAVSGKLNLKMGGPSIYPPLEGQVVGASSKSDWGKSDEVEASRRSVYVFVKRAIPLPELGVLGSPDSSASCGQRNVSTTAVQALLMMNGKFLTEQSNFLAERIRAEVKSEDLQEQVKHAFRLVLCRQPNKDELKQSLEFMAPNSEQGSSKQDSLATLCLVLLNTNEFVYQN